MLHHRLWEEMLTGLYEKQLPTWENERLVIGNWVDWSYNCPATSRESRCPFPLLSCGPGGAPVGGLGAALEWGANFRAGCTWAHLSAPDVKCSANVERVRRRRNSMVGLVNARILQDNEKVFFLTCGCKVFVLSCTMRIIVHMLRCCVFTPIARHTGLESIVTDIPSFSTLGVQITVWRCVLPTR